MLAICSIDDIVTLCICFCWEVGKIIVAYSRALDSTNNCPIYVPCESLEAYKTANGWSYYASRIQGISPCEPQYRTTSGDPYCDGYDKYIDVYNQVSYDGGNTWQTTATTPSMVEHNSTYCGYVPPSPKLKVSYYNGTSYSAACNSSTTLTTGETRLGGYDITAMTSAEIGDCVTTIDSGAFSGCTNLTSVTIPSGVTNIGSYGFYNCGLNSLNLPSDITVIEHHAFAYNSNLSNVTIPNSVTTIGIQAFANCGGLTSVTIGSGVTDIGASTFRFCYGLTSVTINAVTPPTLGSTAFGSTSSSLVIYVPAASVEAYKSASGWSSYASRIQAIA